MTQYLCEKCGKVIESGDLSGLPGIRCPACGHRILYKARSQIVRVVQSK
ncbi:MAG TPA: hypothetical protein P5290_00705 [Candidatus Methanomethylicus sp.]|nr:hypothetical protein [Candidatus Methanomethylicus sp.]HRR53846.1 hypothetical protein [Candidatus Methanomethylicus sp.]